MLLIVLSLCISCKERAASASSLIAEQDIALDTVEYLVLESKIDSLFNEEFTKESFIGAGVSIVINDRIAYEQTFGYRDFTNNLRLDKNSIFRIGSLSKSFTSLLSGILVQQGRLSFDDEIRSQIPEFRLAKSAYADQMTLKHLLSHTGGFPYHSYTNLVESKLPMKKIIPYFASLTGIVQPGTVYSYQNAAFAISGEFMSAASATPLSVLFKEELFDPLEMTSTTVDFESLEQSTNKVLPHSKSADGWNVKKLNKKYYNAIAAGGVNTTTKDMGNFLLATLGRYPRLLSQKTLDKLTEPAIPTEVDYRYYTKWPNFNDSYYGMGWRIHTFNDPISAQIDTLLHHGGMVNGYRSEIAFHKKEDFAVCVMFNSYSAFARDVIPRVIEIIRQAERVK